MNKLEFNCITKVLKKISTIDDEAAMHTEPITWHKDTKNARVCFPVETYNANLQKLLAHNLGIENHPFLAALVVAVQNDAFIRVDAGGMVYYYCDEVYPDDVSIITNYGGYVEPKPID